MSIVDKSKGLNYFLRGKNQSILKIAFMILYNDFAIDYEIKLK